MTPGSSDALVFFGATGDLACKKVFPALQAMAKHGHLNVPVIGEATAGWNLDQLKARARDSSIGSRPRHPVRRYSRSTASPWTRSSRRRSRSQVDTRGLHERHMNLTPS
jgi:hypothetical protein